MYKDSFVGRLRILGSTYYIETNKGGTLRILGGDIKWYARFWLEFREKFKLWDSQEAFEYSCRHKKSHK